MAVAGIALAVGVFAGPASASAEGAKYIHVDTDGYTVIAHGSEWG